ncbi:LysM peptidoglycan-binding domain-containing protein [Aerococcus kribbianus]|uniref:Peptidoglycan hydrolase n=1 Tax=Aerococcus kribbianus TaxID=2999064 RepID=A0A9X3FRM8_9LACT|nr:MULTISPECIES: LysM peptidoglycan-binding domain-containing protein [unclassified Aerococcus]MCZ0717092.1 LysM peptidoglycan-binding domain-containing protein [Aerococcus sp. YH-aer221]MCZ0725380.1 LysM peptidoglycan-binding domain-containing protein [Aerococcus sp. YH-aer222]
MTDKRQSQIDYLNHLSKQSLTVGSIVLGSALAVSAFNAWDNVETVKAEEKTVHFAATQNNFLNTLIPYAYEIAHENDLYASVMMAQAVLETGWGSSGLSQQPYNNLFGIKGSYNGQSAQFNTLEDDGSGNYYQIQDGFRVYPSYRESLYDYADKIRNGLTYSPNFYAGVWKSNTNSYRDATQYLTGRYATDTRYAGKLNQIIENNNLTKYDTPKGASGDVKAVLTSDGQESYQDVQFEQSSSRPKQKVTTSNASYTVRAGDGLYSAARALGTSVAELKATNGLSSNLIFPGQVLYTSKAKSSSQPSAPTSQKETGSSQNTSGSAKTYTVKSGDGLYSVARALGISVSEARQMNGGKDLIFPGQQFTTGAKTSASGQSSAKPATSSNASGKTYTVKSGNGLYSVARALGISVSEARQMNGGKDLIFPGQQFTAGAKTSASGQSSAKPATSSNASGKTYTVKSGDGLYSVARALGISVSEARQMNGGKDLIFPGQQFTAGAKSSASGQSSAKPATSSNASGKTYTVKSGDGLYSVARALGISVSEARQMNGGKDFIYPGQQFTAGANATSANGPIQQGTSSQSTSRSSNGTHTVKAGETAWRIAKANGLSVDQLLQMNGLSNANLYIGQNLRVSGQAPASSQTQSQVKETPTKQTNPQSQPKQVAAQTSNQASAYTVKAGDNLYRIALNHGVELSTLKAANGLTSNAIHVGQNLVIPN